MRLRTLASAVLVLLAMGAAASPVAAASPSPSASSSTTVEGLTMEAHTLLAGHARVGSWMAIAIHVRNDGPPITGELRLNGGAQGRTRFGTPVDLPTTSDKTFLVYAQPPAFGRELQVALVSDDRPIATVKAPFTIHDATQMGIGVIADKPGAIIAGVNLAPGPNQVAPVLVQLTPGDLPERVEAWGGLDRLIWQDVDSSRLTIAQLAALRRWVAGGGRLVIVGGTSGPSSLSAFPDDLLPYRPTATVDVAASSLVPLTGAIQTGAADVPALGGDPGSGRALVMSGDRVIAADRAYGNGSVTLLGFDPTTPDLAAGSGTKSLWRRLLPPVSATGTVLGDDSQMVNAVSQLPSLALPPIGGLIALLGAYILLVGPVNYLILRRLDRREWAWVTMPALIALFAVGAYAFGATLRGSDVLVNEVAIVRGATGTTDGAAQVYVGIFSPSRGTYQVRMPGGALLSAPTAADFGGDASASALDILQGDPSRVRDLAVSFGSLRTIRAESPVPVPLVKTDLGVTNGRLSGTITNASDVAIERPAVVLGTTVAVLDDLAPGATAKVETALTQVGFGQSLSDRVVGPTFFSDTSNFTSAQMNLLIRHAVVDQLTYDPNFGTTNQLAADGAVILGWGRGGPLPVDIEGQKPRVLGNVLYYIPADVAIHGATTFRGDLMRSSVVDSDAAFVTKDPYSINFGRGTATVAYRPISFDGSIAASELTFGMNWGPDQPITTKPKAIEPLPEIPPRCTDTTAPGCSQQGWDGMPEVELFDTASASWVRLPHLDIGTRYSVAQPARYVDPASGAVLVRFVNDRGDGVGFTFDLALAGDVR